MAHAEARSLCSSAFVGRKKMQLMSPRSKGDSCDALPCAVAAADAQTLITIAKGIISSAMINE